MSKLAVLCPGQGAQHAAMFDALLTQPAAAPILAATTRVLGSPPAVIAAAATDALFSNRVAQPLICAEQLAAWAALSSQLPSPRLFAGYSLGELSAYGCAGALDAAHTLDLATARARVMDAAGKGNSMLVAVLGLDRQRVEAVCAALHADIAIANGPDHFVLGVDRRALDELIAAAWKQGAIQVKLLPIQVAAHTQRLTESSEQFRALLAASPLQPPPIPVISGTTAALVHTRAGAIDALAAQLSQTIHWGACMQTMIEEGCRVFLELGPGGALSRMVREAYPEIAARSWEDFHSVDGAVQWVLKELERNQ